jgi:hypothetical protein
MERRSFLAHSLVGLGGLLATNVDVAANDPPVRDLKKSDLAVRYDGDVVLEPTQLVSAWEMNCEEDDNLHFFFRLSNKGSRAVRVVHLQPRGGILTASPGIPYRSPWWIVERMEIIAAGETRDFYKHEPGADGRIEPSGWRVGRDSNAFYLTTEASGRSWEQLPIRSDRDGWTDGANTVAHMEWHNPEIHFEIRSVDRRR